MHALFDPTTFDQALAATSAPLGLFRNAIAACREGMKRLYLEGQPVTELVAARAQTMDQLLLRIWRHTAGSAGEEVALVAVGGYGRGELHPYSDIDIMLLVPEGARERCREEIERFLMFLWDIGLEIGQSVRTVEECVREGQSDITIATNLMEARLLTGSQELFAAMRAATGPNHIWPSRAFFEAKWQEQITRHRKFDDTAYNLEPNIKEGPGGLRDIQMVGWVAKRHFGAHTLHDLVAHGFLTSEEYQALMMGQEFLWKVRFGLHVLAGRREDRLVFDHQRTLAKLLGYDDAGPRLPVEQFMKHYYRTVAQLAQLNELLLELFQEEILYADDLGQPVPINRRFQARKGFIEAVNERVFIRHPFALLELFLHLAQHPELKGVRAGTIRLIRSACHNVDDAFRQDLRCRSLFMELLRQPRGVYTTLKWMQRYGLLGAYLPPFGRIVGQMQHDLFHVYTVDEHTLFVLRNVRRLAIPELAHEFPTLTRLFARVPKPELLYIAALFHDIAKGRGGDHSELGAQEVEGFCRNHLLSDYDTRLVVWLVRHHLIMSGTAQRKDIADPEVIFDFATAVGDIHRLNYLYLLTVADIRATSPTLWNSWKGALLSELYHATRSALRRGLANPVDKEQLIAERRAEARLLFSNRALTDESIDQLWDRLGDDYFLRYTADEIAWHAEAILDYSGEGLPLILIRQETQRGGTELFIYTHINERLFAVTTSLLDQLALNILDARIIPSNDGYSLDTYIILEENGAPISDPRRVLEIEGTLQAALLERAPNPASVQRQFPRQLKHFPIPTQVAFEQDLRNQRTVMEVVSSDRPGLLSRIGRALVGCGVRLHNAKIATLGERVEDIFFITDVDLRPVRESAVLDCLRATIVRLLDG